MRTAQTLATLAAAALVLIALCLAAPPLAAARDDPLAGASSSPVTPPPVTPPPATDPDRQGQDGGDPAKDDDSTGGDTSDDDSHGDGAGDESDKPDAPKRVIIIADRNTIAAGEVIEEDDNIIVIRNRKGDAESFTKARVLSIIPLLNVTEPTPGIVIMRNGQTRRALIVEDEYDHVTVEIEGIRTTFQRSSVSHVTLEPTFEERYREIRRTITTGSIQHQELCRWLMDHRRYDLAVTELEQLIEAGAPSEDAPHLLRIARAQLILMEDKADSPEDHEGDDDEIDERERIIRELNRNILADEDVNLVRVFEIDFRNPPQVVVRPETIRKLQEDFASSPAIPASATERTEMFRADDIELVKLMFELRARDLYPEIEVQTEPHALNQFRDGVHHAWLIRNCATSRCHGGPDGGRLFLHNRNIRDARVWMANFLTLERLEIDPVQRLINYQNPEMSLVLQYALNRNEARMPHPEVAGWEPVFPRKNRQFWAAVGWIDSMMQPRPEYPVEYEPPIPPAARARNSAPGDRTDR